MTNYTKRAVKGTLVVFIFYIVTQLLSYILRLVYARKLDTLDYGLFYATLGFISFFVAFKELGINEALTKFISEFVAKKQQQEIKNSIVYVVLIQFFTTTVFVLVIFLLSPYLSTYYFHNINAALLLKILVAGFFIDAFVVVIKCSIYGFQRLAMFSSLTTARVVSIFILSLIFFHFNFGVLAPVLAYSITPLILLIVYTFLFFKRVFHQFFRLPFFYDKNLFKKIVYYGFPLMLAVVGSSILGYTDNLFLTYFSLKYVALYNVALPTSMIIFYIFISFNYIIFPLSSELWVKDRKDLLREGLGLMYKYIFVAAMPLVVLFLSFPEQIMGLLFGQKYLTDTILIMAHRFLPISITLQILAFGTLFFIFGIMNLAVLQGIGKPKIIMKITYIIVLINIILNAVLIPILGIIGAAIATSTSYITSLIFSNRAMNRFIGVTIPLKEWMKNFLLGLAFVAVAYLFRGMFLVDTTLELIIISFILLLLYALSLFLFRLISISEVKTLLKRISS